MWLLLHYYSCSVLQLFPVFPPFFLQSAAVVSYVLDGVILCSLQSLAGVSCVVGGVILFSLASFEVFLQSLAVVSWVFVVVIQLYSAACEV